MYSADVSERLGSGARIGVPSHLCVVVHEQVRASIYVHACVGGCVCGCAGAGTCVHGHTHVWPGHVFVGRGKRVVNVGLYLAKCVGGRV